MKFFFITNEPILNVGIKIVKYLCYIVDDPNFYETYSIINISFPKTQISCKTGTMLFSSSTIKISAITGPSSDPIATPSVCL